MDSGNQLQTNKEILLGVRALLDKSQGDVAALNRKMDQVNKEISNLQKEHKQHVQKLNSLTAAHEMKGTPRVKRSGCMGLRTIDLTLDEDEEDKAAPAAAGSRKA